MIVNDRDGNPQDVAVGYDDPHQYVVDTETNHTYFGATVGRYANRIKNSTFTIDGVTSHIVANEHGGADTLHGGSVGYDQRNWTVSSVSDDSITFTLTDTGFEGFPGTVVTHTTYTVSEGPRFTFRMVSVALDEPTPIMLSSHVYWNLGAFTEASNPSILNDTLYMPYSDRYIEVDNILIPNGTIGVVNGTVLDFTSPRQIGSEIDNAVNVCGLGCTGYDSAFIVDRPRYSGPESTDLTLLSMWSNKTGIRLDIQTNQQGFQIFTCDSQNGTIPVKASQQHGNSTTYIPKYGCIVIETQQWIDGINNPQWGQNDYQIYSPSTGPAVVYSQYDFSTFT